MVRRMINKKVILLCTHFRLSTDFHLAPQPFTFHNGQKPFKCNMCEKRFASSGNCKAHMNTHIQMKIFSCFACGKTFKLPKYLDNHMKKIHVKFVKPEMGVKSKPEKA